jgi:hypothetical protein
MMSSHKIQTTSFRLWALAEADEHRAGEFKTGLKSKFGPVEPEQGVTKSNWAYAVSSDIAKQKASACEENVRATEYDMRRGAWLTIDISDAISISPSSAATN